MMKNCYLSREQYEELFSRTTYPKRVGKAVVELRDRGIVVIGSQLKYLVTKGVCFLKGGGARGANFRWTSDQIDKAAEYFANIGKLTYPASVCDRLNLSLYQYKTALDKASSEIDGIDDPGNPRSYRVVVHPGNTLRGICGRIEFLDPYQPQQEGSV
jgi:hypothetical protein